MDDTLYLERDFVRSGFQAVASHCAQRVPVSARSIFDALWQDFDQGIRGEAFDRLIDRLPSLRGSVSVEELISVYRAHEPDITLAQGMPALLTDLRGRGSRLGMITDGVPAMQRRKSAALGLARWDVDAVYPWDWGPAYGKPHARAFVEMETRSGAAADRLTYVADNPAKDFVAPKARGWRTIRLRMPGQLHELAEASDDAHAPDVEARDVATLARMLLSEVSDGR
jgi:putative hydrolase of the HAD superfamily